MKRSSSISDKKSSSLFNNVVLEIGSTLVRGGIAGECVPRFIIPTPFFNMHNSQGDDLSHVSIKMNCLEGIRLIFLEHLQIRSKDCNVLIIENMFAPTFFRDQLFNVLLNEMQVQSVCFQPDMLMPILATGCQSGLIVDIGSQECRAVCVAFGRPLLATFVASPIGVSHASSRFHRSLNSSLQSTTGDVERAAGTEESKDHNGDRNSVLDSDFTATLFEKTAIARSSSGSSAVQAADVVCVSGDGGVNAATITVPGWLRHSCLTSLIEGDKNDPDSRDELGGVLGLMLACLLKCSADVRSLVANNLVLTGGGAQLPGLPESICDKLSELMNKISESTSFVHSEYINKLRPLFLSDDINNCAEASENVAHVAAAMRKRLALHCFPKSSLNWIGGSLFASVKMNRSNKYVEREEFLLKTRTSKSKSNSTGASAGASARATSSATASEQLVLLSAPDWLSTNPSDWRFYGTGEYVKAASDTEKQAASSSKVLASTASRLGKKSTADVTSSKKIDGSQKKASSASFFESLLKK